MGNCTCSDIEDDVEIETKGGLLKLKKVKLDTSFQKQLEEPNQEKCVKETAKPEDPKNKECKNIEKLNTNDSNMKTSVIS